MMNHPTHEEWAEYLYGETDDEQREKLTVHLRNCAECRSLVDGWRETMYALHQWESESPPKRKRRLGWGTALRWAAAACMALAVGYAGASLAVKHAVKHADSRPLDETAVETLRAALHEELRASLEKELTQEMANEMVITMDAARRQLYADLRAASRRDMASFSTETQKELQGWLDRFTYKYVEDQTQKESFLAQWADSRDRQYAQDIQTLQTGVLRLANMRGYAVQQE